MAGSDTAADQMVERLIEWGIDVMKGRAGFGGSVGARWSGGRRSALRRELRGLRPRGLRPRGRTIREEDRP